MVQTRTSIKYYALQIVTQLQEQHKLIIKSVDKNVGLTVMSLDWYLQELDKQLTSEPYQHVSETVSIKADAIGCYTMYRRLIFFNVEQYNIFAAQKKEIPKQRERKALHQVTKLLPCTRDT